MEEEKKEHGKTISHVRFLEVELEDYKVKELKSIKRITLKEEIIFLKNLLKNMKIEKRSLEKSIAELEQYPRSDSRKRN